MAYFLGLDLGTSALKGLVFDQTGELQGTASVDYPLSSPRPGFSEQEPVHWQEAADKVIKTLIQQLPKLQKELIGISFSGQMHSLVLLDEENRVIRPAILWNDVRTTKQCQAIMASFGEEIKAITKNVALEGFTLPKILWVQEHEPEHWQQVRHMMLPKDYLAFWLTGNYSMDYSDAAGTLLLDIEKKCWSEAILEKFAIASDLLPPLFESAAPVGQMRKELQEAFGFEQEVTIYAGGADNACAALGSGIIAEGVGMVSIGTSGVFLSFEEAQEVDYQGDLHLFRHAIKDKLYSMGVTLAAGNSLSWYRDTFAPNQSFQELLSAISEVKPGAEGLLFTPYIVGERTPHTDSQIRGSFIGIDTRHREKHFSRAVLEGITFSLKDSQMIMEERAQRKFTQIVSVGGGAKNAEWLQMQADIFNAEMLTLSTEQGPGMGAAMLAAIGSGIYPDAAACVNAFVKYSKAIAPIPENVAKYQEIYAIYRTVYQQTAPICHALAQIE
ncbi:xylulokinase [Enterococcus casseliflavus]|uniref:xylulokinase n=1 Tax=unclassified Enterococcus TaxID=2608891 RepID=UPI000A33C91D|nr:MULTISPECIES: xylulokinase [unclassified Enterococcus]MBO1095666.1 xylulokinase [Enterococcus casseliflavus]MBO1144033.1 xylulokinase [Enterococcus casseliflavus]MBV6369635.1 xylulokinase [Enterococcus casseliflavus]OTO25617.1 xylulokinase [Enterococcus sp. 3C7_DIV0644]OUZ34355.1 xylulokinase [Enterococcus sp. 8E11_MSG4843]